MIGPLRTGPTSTEIQEIRPRLPRGGTDVKGTKGAKWANETG